MKLKIIEYFWAVGHRTRRKGSHKIPLVAGQTLDVDYMQLKIEKADQKSVTVSYCRKDGTVVKTFTFDQRVGYYYRPTSFDAGHEYRFKVTRFFLKSGQRPLETACQTKNKIKKRRNHHG